MRRKKQDKSNYLDKIPKRNGIFSWRAEETGSVTIEVENKGVANKIAQKLLKKPKISYVHLDEMGSFIWPLIDGEKSVYELGICVEERFGEEANPLYERLVSYMRILESYGFIGWNEKNK